jgi:CDP-L-myo-inositol myo-inositolphosphotransferase
MKALIIAAGNGTRMQPVTRGRHKSLMPLLGLKIIERVILGAKEAGINEFVIVTGYKGDVYRKAVGDGSRYGISIKYVQNDKWKKPNGLSVLCAKKYLKENFVLMMSDHVFDATTLKRLLRLKIKKDECILAVDKNLGSVLDVSDTTKTVVVGGRVTNIGKHLEKYNAYDTGMFYCTPYLFKALETVVKREKMSLTNGMNFLVKRGLLRSFDIRGRFWSDCDTYADVQFAEKKLLKTLSKQADGIIAKKFNRRVSVLITRLLIKTPITPNVISFSIPILAIVTFFVLAKGVYPWLVVGGILTQFMSIIDGCDGEIARLKFMRSKWGGFLDANLDKYVDTAVIAGMSLGYLKVTGNNFILPLALFVIFALGLDGYMPNKFEIYVGKRLNFYAPQFINFKRDIRLLILAFGAIFNQILFAFLIILFVYHLKVVIRLISGKRICEEILVKTPIASQV